MKNWEREIIPEEHILHAKEDDGRRKIVEHCRDWMLGGENMEWRYHRDLISGDIIMERR